MKILRDETGEVTLGLATNTQTAATPFNPEPIPPAAASRTVRPTQHCCFQCNSCEAIISLPHNRLGLAFAAPVLRRTDVRSIGTVCPSCHHVGVFSLFRGACGYDTRHKLAAVEPDGNTLLIDMLRCDEETCAHPLPLFLTSQGELRGEAVKELGRGWEWAGLTCASGHRIRRPNWLYDRQPLIFPQALK